MSSFDTNIQSDELIPDYFEDMANILREIFLIEQEEKEGKPI